MADHDPPGSRMTPPAPASPWVWVVSGAVAGALGAVFLLAGADTRAEDSIRPLIGTILLSLGGFLVLVGAAGLGALTALRRHAWELTQREEQDDRR